MVTEIYQPTHSRFKWINIVDPTVDELNQVGQQYKLHPTSVEDCLEPYHLPKYEKIDDVVFIIARTFDDMSPADADTVHKMTRKLAIFYGDGFLITIQRKPITFVVQWVEKWGNPEYKKERSGVQLLLALLDEVGWSYKKPLEDADDLITQYEDSIFNDIKCEFRVQNAYDMKRRALVIKKMLRMTVDILRKLDQNTTSHAPYFQSVREDVEGLFYQSDEMVEDCNSLLNIYLSLSSHNTNEIMRVLTMVSIFFLPITFIAGVYGMNFEGMPELHWGYGYFFSLGMMLVVEVSIYFYFKRKGWL